MTDSVTDSEQLSDEKSFIESMTCKPRDGSDGQRLRTAVCVCARAHMGSSKGFSVTSVTDIVIITFFGEKSVTSPSLFRHSHLYTRTAFRFTGYTRAALVRFMAWPSPAIRSEKVGLDTHLSLFSSTHLE